MNLSHVAPAVPGGLVVVMMAAWAVSAEPEAAAPAPVTVRVEAGTHDRPEQVVDASLPADPDDKWLTPSHVIEVDAVGKTIRPNVPFQYDRDRGQISLLLPGPTAAESTRTFEVHRIRNSKNLSAVPPRPLVTCSTVKNYQGQETLKIATPAATYYYHLAGAGFASLVDVEKRDWISYRPRGGSAGNFRGIPNLSHPEGYFHPGGTKCTTEVLSTGPLKAVLVSKAQKGAWCVRWEIYPDRATLTVMAAPKPYWFLYEGTPGGKIEYDTDYCLRSDGQRSSAGEKWDRKLKLPGWVCFGDSKRKRALCLVNHNALSRVDSYWPMQKNMTVFGFGRRGLGKSLKKTGARFTVRLVEADSDRTLKSLADATATPMTVTVTPKQANANP